MVVGLPMPTALKLGCVSNLDTLFLMMEFISLVDEIQFMLILKSLLHSKMATTRRKTGAS